MSDDVRLDANLMDSLSRMVENLDEPDTCDKCDEPCRLDTALCEECAMNVREDHAADVGWGQ